MKKATASLIFYLPYSFIINMYICNAFTWRKYVRGRANVFHKMTGRTCQMLFTACNRELKNNLFGLCPNSAYAQKPIKFQTPQILKRQNPVIKCFDIHHLSDVSSYQKCIFVPFINIYICVFFFLPLVIDLCLIFN